MASKMGCTMRSLSSVRHVTMTAVPPHNASAACTRWSARPVQVMCARRQGAGKVELAMARGRSKKRPQRKGSAAPVPEVYAVEPALEDDFEDSEEQVSWDAKMDAVVKVYCVHTEPNFSMPWQRRRQYASTSTGFVYDVTNRRLLTNAHSVDHFTQVKVKRRGDDAKFVARVLAVGTECDIAMLTVEDDAFWEGLEALSLGSLPRLQEGVAVVGYPVGGDTISVTSGVVSRIEVTSYVHGMTDLLSIQIDAAINSGNSGGPVFNQRQECVGIAFQSLRGEDAENIGYVIPTPVVEHFLADYEENQSFTGFPVLGISWQSMESPAMRAVLKMLPSHSGVLVREVQPTSTANGVLQVNDVVLEFEGVSISNDGTVPFRRGERISFGYLVSQKYVGGVATLRVLRGGEELEVQTTLSQPTFLMPSHIGGKEPSYFIVAGLVFIVASELYLRSEFGAEYLYDAPVSLLNIMTAGVAKEQGEQVVVLSQVLAADVNLGYESVNNTIVEKFNGVEIKSLRQLAELVQQCTEPFMQLELYGKELVVLETAAARAATQEIMEVNSIPCAMSADLVAELGATGEGIGQPAAPAQKSDRDSMDDLLDESRLS